MDGGPSVCSGTSSQLLRAQALTPVGTGATPCSQHRHTRVVARAGVSARSRRRASSSGTLSLDRCACLRSQQSRCCP